MRRSNHIVTTSDKEIFFKMPILNHFGEVLFSHKVSFKALSKIVSNANKKGNNLLLLRSENGVIMKKLKPIHFDIYFNNRF